MMLPAMNPSIPTADYNTTCTPKTKKRGGGNKIMVGTVVKAKLGELEEDIREGFSRRLRKEMTGVVHEVVRKRRYLEGFQDGLEKEMS